MGIAPRTTPEVPRYVTRQGRLSTSEPCFHVVAEKPVDSTALQAADRRNGARAHLEWVKSKLHGCGPRMPVDQAVQPV